MRRDLIWGAAVLLCAAGSAGAQPAASGKTAGEAMKDVRVLKDVPVEEWTDTMRFMSNSLGVSCDHCHVGEAYEKEDRKAKQTARAMIQMTRELNAKTFGGRMVVTCYTCHQNSVRPKESTALWGKDPEPAGKVETPAGPLPDGEQVLAKYRAAVGSDGVKTVHVKATASFDNRTPLELEADLGLPDRVILKTTIGGGEFRQIFDRDHGWAVAPGRVVEMGREAQAGVARMVSMLGPVKLQPVDAPRRTTGFEKAGGRTLVVLESRSATRLERLYFDQQTGLLYKIYMETRTPLGAFANETVLEDYRDVAGVKMPMLMTTRASNERVKYAFSDVQMNVPLDEGKFERPKEGAGKE